ncbi:MAG: histidine ammonia-lyase [Myxococcales bacterium]|nr:histidine ammonia-lyase [Myxococcales bacterium]
MANPVLLGESVSLDDLVAVARRGRAVQLSDEARARMSRSRAAIDAVTDGGADAPRVYGVNTGFGALAETRISPGDVRTLQHNLLRSHACGLGAPLSDDLVRAMMFLRAQVLALGFSGVRPVVVETLVAMLNAGVHPVIPSQGSVGASGDLAPLAHLALVLIGEGDAQVDGVLMAGAEALRLKGIAPLALGAKEGLSLINGTQFMLAHAVLLLDDARALARHADLAGAMSLEALKGSGAPFDERVIAVRPHPGALTVAANLRAVLGQSEIAESHRNCGKVQDPYSLRCMPQVHGASRDAFDWCDAVFAREVNSVTDNPLVFLGEGVHPDVVSGGNFHGQPLALALDLMAMAVAELANISERRIEQLVNPALSSGLPPFLAPNTGLDSGFMIAQVTAAALVNENKTLCHPSSVDSIPSSAGREDHVSMGATGATKCARVVQNVRAGLAIELLVAAQGVDVRRPLKPGRGVAAAHAVLRGEIATLEGDRTLAPDIQRAIALVASGRLLRAAETVTGPLG